MKSSLLLLGMAAALAWTTGPGACGGELRAGAGRANLTPPMSMKAALGGYGARLSKPAAGVHDLVWAKALVLRQDDRRFALVTADLLGFPPGFEAAVVERLAGTGWRADDILLLPSHSHTSFDLLALHPANTFGIPQAGVFQRAAFEHVATVLAQAIREADRGVGPVRVGTGTATLEGRNRNRRGGDGPHDPELIVLRVDHADGRPLAALVNWAAHPTFMDEEDMLFSGDWPGHLQRTFEALAGEGMTVLFCNGAEGDQSPVPPAVAGSNWERAERYGREMALEAHRVWQRVQGRPDVRFASRTEAIPLPARRAHPDFMKTGGAEYGLNEAMMQGFVEHLIPPATHSTSLRLGDLVVVGVPGELASGLGLRAKAEVRAATGAAVVAIGGLADEWVGYLLPPEQYRRGGYEASMSFHGETVGGAIVEGVVRGARKLE